MQRTRGEIVTAAVVGAGQIGSRHVQALAKSAHVRRVEVVGRSAASLALAEERYRSVAPGSAQSALFTHQIADLSERIDFAIIATNSDTRLAVLQELLRSRSVRAVILEKVAFQSGEEFAAAELAACEVPVWVNCFRRASPLYTGLRPRSLTVEGGEWGLGCNAVHYVDLCAFLAGSGEIVVEGQLDREILASKRKGFVEFTGRIRGSCGSCRFELVARAGSVEPATVRIDDAVFDESGLPLQSNLTHLLVDEILATGRSALPTLQQSRTVHLPLLELFTRHLERVTGQRPARCPIT